MQDIVLCKVYRKATSLKVLEQRVAMEEEMKNFQNATSPASSPMDTISFCSPHEQLTPPPSMSVQQLVLKREVEEEAGAAVLEATKGDQRALTEVIGSSSSTSLQVPYGYKGKLPEIQVPNKLGLDWTQEQFWTQLNSPWLQNLTPLANILNF